MNMQHIYNDHIGSDMTFKQFVDICGECWKDNYGFMVVSKDNEINLFVFSVTDDSDNIYENQYSMIIYLINISVKGNPIKLTDHFVVVL